MFQCVMTLGASVHGRIKEDLAPQSFGLPMYNAVHKRTHSFLTLGRFFTHMYFSGLKCLLMLGEMVLPSASSPAHVA